MSSTDIAALITAYRRIEWRVFECYMMFHQTAEYDKRVANVSLFIYIGRLDYIQILATCLDLCATRFDLVSTVATYRSPSRLYIYLYLNIRGGVQCLAMNVISPLLFEGL